jgi:hypothetical protein
VLWLRNLQTNAHFLVHGSWVLAHKVLDCEGVEDVLIIFGLVILAELVSHDDCTCGKLSLASLKVVMVQRVALQVVHS